MFSQRAIRLHQATGKTKATARANNRPAGRGMDPERLGAHAAIRKCKGTKAAEVVGVRHRSRDGNRQACGRLER